MRFVLFIMALCFCGVAQAHVTANPDTGIAESYFETAFRVSHGCDGSDTTEVTITMPKGMITAKPQHKAGWSVEIKKSKLDKPVPAGHGKMADEQVDQVIWRGGALPDGEYDTFGILMKLPSTPQTLWFPVTQTCTKGENKWAEIPAAGQEWHSLKAPAPFVKVQGAPMPEHHH